MEIITQMPEALKKTKKSTVVDNGLKENLSNSGIVEKVKLLFPEATDKSIRNLISVRRSRMKKLTQSSIGA